PNRTLRPILHPGSRFMPSFSFLDREHSVAGPGYSRWLVPPAALAIHLSIGQAYAFSVFKIPMTTLLGITAPASGDWRQGTIAHLFQVAIAFLGVSAAVLSHFRSPTSMGVAETFVALGVIYLVFMMFGVFSVRLPIPGWAPRGYKPAAGARHMITTANVEVGAAVRTPQFWLLWTMLCV